jgi:hypothetical protein
MDICIGRLERETNHPRAEENLMCVIFAPHSGAQLQGSSEVECPRI